MLKMLWKTTLGFALIIVGFFLIYYFVKQDGAGESLALLSIPLFGLGAFLIKTGADAYEDVFKGKLKPIEADKLNNEGFEGMLEKNNALTADFAKTNKARTKLKMMQSAASAMSEDPKRF